MKRKVLFILSAFVLLLAPCCYFFSSHFLWWSSCYLISEDEPVRCEAIFVLGGDSYDRGNYAIKLFEKGFSNKIICVGENIPNIFKSLGITYSESEVTKLTIQKAVPENKIEVLKTGTSTMEEARAIVKYCLTHEIGKAIVITSRFHTRRVRKVFEPLSKPHNVQLLIAGAPSSVYSEKEWWKSEEGLIMVNNEYVKLMYYAFKY